MSHWAAVTRITAWEFKRFLRLRELLTTVIVVAVLGAGVPLVIEYMQGRNAERVVTLAVAPGSDIANSGRFEFVELDDAAAAAALEAEDVDGVLDLSSIEEPKLVTEREPGWLAELNAVLSEAALAERLAASSVTQDEFAALVRPVELQVETPPEVAGSGGGPIGAIIGIMLFAIFTGTGLLFTAITGEKTQRVTEQIVSAVSPQSWIDGKVLGTGLYVIVNLVTIGVGIVLAVVVPQLIRGQGLPPLPSLGSSSAGVLVVTVAFAVLGAALYFMLFAAVAATIDDPATSQRSGIIMLPGLFVGLGFLGLVTDPGNALFRTLSYIPLTSPSAMPVRFLAGDAGVVEVLVSLAVLVVTVVLARGVAGRIFSLGILMTGKEPSWREMLYWLRRS
jgi:ABC-2 type transport system permease protein